MEDIIKMRFKDAPIGARFYFYNGDGTKAVYIKVNEINNGLVVKWNGNIIGHQSHCCWIDKANGYDFNTIIDVINK